MMTDRHLVAENGGRGVSAAALKSIAFDAMESSHQTICPEWRAIFLR